MARFNVDFTGSDRSAGPAPGDYVCKVTKITVEDGIKAKYLKWELTVGIGPNKGDVITTNTSLSKKALFRLRNMIISLGISCPASAFGIDTAQYVGKIVGATVAETEYTDKKTGKMKKGTDVEETWRVIKVGKTWQRTESEPEDEEEPDEVEVPEEVDPMADITEEEDDTDEIDFP